MRLSRLMLLFAVAAAALLLVAGPGVRLDWWTYRTGFQLMRWAAYAGIAIAALSVALLLVPSVRRAGARFLAAAVVVAAVVVLIPWGGLRNAQRLPPIHDITTDTQDPPAFVAVLPLRADAPNSAVHGGTAVADAQRAGYPDLVPVHLASAPPVAFAKALDAARAMGWEIVDADAATGRIEATDTTRWFGFKDDVVIRVRADGAGSRIDVRSVSRVGGSDVGANAARIRAYSRRLR